MNTETTERSSVQQPFESDESEMLTGHSYDGIQEYDNPLPGWWKFLFWFFILIGPPYYLYMHAGIKGRSIIDQYTTHMSSIYELRFKGIGILEPDRETIMKYVNDEPDWLAVGKVTYDANCVSCHGASGEGKVGPNLTDEFWKNVRNVEDIAKVIQEGAANGAMPAWKNRLTHPNQVVLTAAYVASLRKNPVGGKQPEGNKIPAWEK